MRFAFKVLRKLNILLKCVVIVNQYSKKFQIAKKKFSYEVSFMKIIEIRSACCSSRRTSLPNLKSTFL